MFRPNRPHLSRSRVVLAATAAFVSLAATVGVAAADEPNYTFVKTGMWSFAPGASTPYVLTSPNFGSTKAGTPDNYRFAIREYQRILNEDFGIKTSVDGIYGAGTARSVAALQDRLAPQAAAQGLDLGVRGNLNANTAYLMVKPILEREAAANDVPLGLLTCHAMLEGGFNMGAALSNGGSTIDTWDLGPVQFSMRWNKSRGMSNIFNADYAYNAMAANEAAFLKRFPGKETEAAYAWNSPSDARNVARTGAAPAGDGQIYLDWINNCRTTSVFGRDA